MTPVTLEPDIGTRFEGPFRPMAARLELILGAPALPMFGVAVVIFLLGWFGLARERLSSVNVSFFLLTLSASWWLATTSILMMSAGEATAVMWAHITYIGVCAIPSAMLQFSLALVDQVRQRMRMVIAAWSGTAVFIVLFFTSGDFITGVWRYSWGHYTRLGTASAAFLAFFITLIAASLHTLNRAMKNLELSEQHKKRIAAFLTALAVGSVASVDFLPSFGVAIYPVGYIAAFACIALCGRAIWRFSFADLTPTYLVAQLVESVQGGVVVVDMHGTVRVANPAAAELLASSPEALAGKNLREVLTIECLPASDSATFIRVGRTRNQSTTWRRHDGSTVDVSFSATLLRDRDRLPVGILYVLHDLTERRRAERHEFAANHDALTGLPNRTYFARRFDATVGEISAHGRVAAVFFLDLDGFKEINDRHGHTAGDRILQLAGARLRNALREDDILVRHGGDEFVALVSLRWAEDGAIVAEKLKSVLRREPFALDTLTLSLSASVGVAIASRGGIEIDELIRSADEAMYRDKREHHPRTDRATAPPFAIESRA